jgi:hypothetical protein
LLQPKKPIHKTKSKLLYLIRIIIKSGTKVNNFTNRSIGNMLKISANNEF